LNKELIFENVYQKPNENVYLASFMKSLSDFKDKEWVRNLVYNGMREFIDIHVTCYKNYREVPVHFIGSVAYHFKDVLTEACESYEVRLGKVIKQPIYNLVDYHLEEVS